MKRLLSILLTAGALLLGSATAQYGYPYGNPFGYDPSAFMYANPYGYQPMMPGAGGYYDPTMAGLGYYDPPMNGFGYYDPSMFMGLGDPYLAEQIRQGEAQMAALIRQGNEQMAAGQQQLDQWDAYNKQLMAQINQYYIDLYRTTTGDQASPDETALYYGQILHCQQNPVDCENAARNAKAAAEEAAARGRALLDAWGK